MDFNNKAASSVAQASSLWGFVEAGSSFAATKTHRLKPATLDSNTDDHEMEFFRGPFSL
jgi:hypothetical protein